MESCDFDPLAFVVKYRVLTLDIGIKPLNYSNRLDPEMPGYIMKKGDLVVIKDHGCVLHRHRFQTTFERTAFDRIKTELFVATGTDQQMQSNYTQ